MKKHGSGKLAGLFFNLRNVSIIIENTLNLSDLHLIGLLREHPDAEYGEGILSWCKDLIVRCKQSFGQELKTRGQTGTRLL